MIKVKEADILTTDKDIIVQQVNCIGVMGSGLAKSILQKYPEVKREYQKYHREALQKYNGREKLLGAVNFVPVADNKVIANVFGQVDVRKDARDREVYTVKSALLEGISTVKDYAESTGLSVALPTHIGCGLAGGNWQEIRPEIEKIFENSSVPVEFYHKR